MRSRPFVFTPPTEEEMNIYLLGRAWRAYRNYWKRTGCTWNDFYQLSHIFHYYRPRSEARTAFPRRIGWLGRVKRRSRQANQS